MSLLLLLRSPAAQMVTPGRPIRAYRAGSSLLSTVVQIASGTASRQLRSGTPAISTVVQIASGTALRRLRSGTPAISTIVVLVPGTDVRTARVNWSGASIQLLLIPGKPNAQLHAGAPSTSPGIAVVVDPGAPLNLLRARWAGSWTIVEYPAVVSLVPDRFVVHP
jgi:hypothetical protein